MSRDSTDLSYLMPPGNFIRQVGEKSLKHHAAGALKTLQKMDKVPWTYESSGTLYIMPYSERDARLFIKAWEMLFPKPVKRPLIHNGRKP
jgi:hypothetical protein